MGGHSAVADLIRRARRRHIRQLILSQGFFAIAAGMAAIVVLLLVGTEILAGGWVASVVCLAFLLGLYRAKSRLLTPYRLAQRLDGRLHFADRLSTAVFFEERPDYAGVPAESIARQKADAEDVARSADLDKGLPFVWPRSVYAGSMLACAALALFGIRYGVTRNLDLRASLVQIAFNGLMGAENAAADRKHPTGRKQEIARAKESEISADPWESKTLDQEGAPDSVLDTVDDPNPNNANYDSGANPKAKGAPTKDPTSQEGESAGDSEKSTNGSDQTAENAADGKDGGREAKQPQSGQQHEKEAPNSSGENSSMADKMRDALSNLMSKLRSQKPGEGKQGGQQSQPGQQAQQRQGKDDKGQPQGQPQSNAMSSQEQQGDQEGQSSDQAAAAQNKSSSHSSDKPPAQDGKSGIGKEDGDKSAREAEQLAAMGKINEIIGKRNANMTGEVMVEVTSGKQQLKTQYSQQKAAHADAGGDLNRDEVPLAYQQFVQQYFEEIHKAAPAASSSAKTKKSPGT